MDVLIVPSILAADFARLGEEVGEAEAAGADRIQIDIMDGHFVPNLSMGPAIVEAVRRVSDLPIEAHLMVERPERFVEMFARAGADYIQVQVESTFSLYRTLTSIVEMGARPGVAINPATPVEALHEVLAYVTQVNVMTVEPGFGGQRFIESMPDKIKRLRQMAPRMEIEVDGGIDAATAPVVVAAGARALVAGSSVFKHEGGIAAGIMALRDAVKSRAAS